MPWWHIILPDLPQYFLKISQLLRVKDYSLNKPINYGRLTTKMAKLPSLLHHPSYTKWNPHQMENRASLNVVLLGCLVICHLLSTEN